MEAVLTVAEHALAADDPWLGLEGFFVSVCELQAADRGLRELAFAGRHGRERVARAKARLEPLIAEVVARGQASGQLRADIRPDDIPLIQKMLSEIIEITGEVVPASGAATSRSCSTGCAPSAPVPRRSRCRHSRTTSSSSAGSGRTLAAVSPPPATGKLSQNERGA